MRQASAESCMSGLFVWAGVVVAARADQGVDRRSVRASSNLVEEVRAQEGRAYVVRGRLKFARTRVAGGLGFVRPGVKRSFQHLFWSSRVDRQRSKLLASQEGYSLPRKRRENCWMSWARASGCSMAAKWPTLFHRCPPPDVGASLGGQGSRWPQDLFRECSVADGHVNRSTARDRTWTLQSGEIGPERRTDCAGKPVEAHIGEQIVL